jgi:hypothetical protein
MRALNLLSPVSIVKGDWILCPEEISERIILRTKFL